MTISEQNQLIGPLLRDVSRSFYLTLRVLPREIRPQISLAYLLARATDTIADTKVVPRAKRVALLRQMQTLSRVPELGSLAEHQSLPAEKHLLERLGECFDALNQFDEADCRRIQELLQIIISGQILDLERFPGESERELVALANDGELDRYTYMVAGCVGEFWTKMCRMHVFPRAPLDDAALLRDGIRFGKGLQLVNILRDLPRDLRQGRCYLSLERLARVQLTPADLLDAKAASCLRPVYDELLDLAEAHLAAGWTYTNSLPRSAMRVRLACAWPVLIGVKTLARLRRENPLDGERRVKVSRTEVKRIIAATLLRYPFASSWGRLFQQAKS